MYWAMVIREIPRYEYHPRYGVLSMMPFFFGWLSFILIPVLNLFQDKYDTLEKINHVCFLIVYFPISLILLAIFIAVNLLLTPFAYIKTVTHKVLLFKRYKSKSFGQSLLTFFLLGIPFLLCSQFIDAAKFMNHTYSKRQR